MITTGCNIVQSVTYQDCVVLQVNITSCWSRLELEYNSVLWQTMLFLPFVRVASIWWTTQYKKMMCKYKQNLLFVITYHTHKHKRPHSHPHSSKVKLRTTFFLKQHSSTRWPTAVIDADCIASPKLSGIKFRYVLCSHYIAPSGLQTVKYWLELNFFPYYEAN